MAVAFRVETGSGADTDANSYVSVEDANVYHDGSLYATEWNAANLDEKKRALISATRTIDSNCVFRGYRKLIVQPLEWPRVRAKNDAFYGGTQFNILYTSLPYYDENSIPLQLATATAYLGLEILRGDRSVDAGSKGISDLSLGGGAIAITFAPSDRPAPLTDELRRMLGGLVESFRGYHSGSKRVTRTL